jgi:hypothetical protein
VAAAPSPVGRRHGEGSRPPRSVVPEAEGIFTIEDLNTPGDRGRLRGARGRAPSRSGAFLALPDPRLRLQKVEQQLLTNGGHDRLGMKLNTLNRVAPVAQAHDLPLSGFSGDL